MANAKSRTKLAFIPIIALLLFIVGCSSNNNDAAPTESAAGSSASASVPAASEPATKKELIPITQVLNWFAQPEQGGMFAAKAKGYYEEAGLDMTIEQGGPQVSHIQIVASGKAQFGMAQGDELVMARAQGIPVVALAAQFQINPTAILFHKGDNVKSFADLNGRTIYLVPGSMYWEYFKKKYNLGKVKELAFTGNFTGFINDKQSMTHAYVTAEPITMAGLDVETEYIRTHDFGYQPYANVIFTTEKYLKEHPDIVKAYVEASVKGWQYYKTNYEEINPVIKEMSPDLELKDMKLRAVASMDLIFKEEAATKGFGTMSKERWDTLMNQLYDIGMIKKKFDVTELFDTSFLPKA
ncbi:ABC transporter substrate-binding protein [Cohnella silvisoli]|uniref:ABC transporter substrate-binding protein n=1 Tax=Cohnella silvisoli TaxID=2873699 RepID=A0ABV1KR22_9BACL|nr:ABC transporter substrate-binding protein [Cohnella silvisoli]MCD9024609.1 ABC transporter substrate-binding protein [Cohnella silvisoli]